MKCYSFKYNYVDAAGRVPHLGKNCFVLIDGSIKILPEQLILIVQQPRDFFNTVRINRYHFDNATQMHNYINTFYSHLDTVQDYNKLFHNQKSTNEQ